MDQDERARAIEAALLGDTSRDRRFNAVWDSVGAKGRRYTVAEAIAQFGRAELERAMEAGWIVAGYPAGDEARAKVMGPVALGFTRVAETLDEAEGDMVLYSDELDLAG
jgi:hypothetical protein